MPKFLTGNALKLLAALFMTIDHIGVVLFPRVLVLRIIGRLALPIFAYMIAEGCKYTRNKKKYFGMIFLLATLCQTVYFFVDGTLYLSILYTFSLSILTVYAMQNLKNRGTTGACLLFLLTVSAVWVLNLLFTIDYGFWGCMLPVFAAVFHGTKKDRLPVSIGMLGIGLVLLSLELGDSIQLLSLAALPLLLCYNGKRGSWNLKYFFYIFYPVHLAVLQGIAWLVY